MISGYELAPKTGIVNSLLLLLHGYGDSGSGFFPIAEELAPHLPTTHIISLNAPYPFEFGFDGRQWFGLTNRSEESMLNGLRNIEPILGQYIDQQLIKFKLEPKQIGLFGFSQGAMVSLHVGLRRKSALAGIISCSGTIVAPQLLKNELRSTPQISLIHGELDEVIPYEALAYTRNSLEENGLEVSSFSEKNIGHTISMAALNFATQKLKKYFKYD